MSVLLDHQASAEPPRKGRDLYPSQWVMLPLWLIDPEDTRILNGPLKTLFRTLLLDTLKQGTHTLRYSTRLIATRNRLDEDTLRGYLLLLQRKGLITSWCYQGIPEDGTDNQWTIDIPKTCRMFWMVAPKPGQDEDRNQDERAALTTDP